MYARVVAVVALAAVALVVVVGASSAFGAVRDLLLGTTAGSRIAFTSFRNGSFDLYVMNADGSKQRRLTPERSTRPRVLSPAWSPDGRRIAFEGGRGACVLDYHYVGGRNAGTGDVDIVVANVDGNGLLVVTDGPGVDCAPVWSPDGRKIAFQRSLGHKEGDRVVGVDYDVYVVNTDGSEERNLTDDALSVRPMWSPDGQEIAFWSGPDGAGGIYVMHGDGSDRRLVARNHGLVAWSPDGKKILLLRGGHQVCRAPCLGGGGSTKASVVVANVDGSGLRNLTRIWAGNGSTPSWSPDGRKIVFVNDRAGNPEIYVMNADGSGQRNLSRHPGHDSDPEWSPDGKRIAFTTKREGNFETYVMNADGSDQRNLTRNPAPDRYPVWSPGRKHGG
jgi:Tol biopolymer transport system component